MAKVGTFVESFDSGTQNPQLSGWGNAGIALAGGKLRIEALRDYTGIGSATDDWDLTGSSFAFQVTRPTKADGGQLGFSFGIGSVEVGWTVSTTYTSSYTGNNYTDHGTAIASPWLRIRESGGTIYWETSPDGVTYTQVRTMATPAGATAVGFSWFSGGGPSNTVGQNSTTTIDNVNTTGGGFSSAFGASASGSLAAAVTLKRVTTGASSVGVGTLAAAPALRRDTVTLPGRTASGTLAATGTQTQLRQVERAVEATLSTTPRPQYRASIADGAEATLSVETRARIIAEATIDLDTVWLNVAANRADGRAFVTLDGLTVQTEREGEVRRYTTGRLRSVLKAGRKRSASLNLLALSRDEVQWLEGNVGELLCFRDDRGRKFYGVFLSVPVAEHKYNGEADVSLSLAEVTYSEVV